MLKTPENAMHKRIEQLYIWNQKFKVTTLKVTCCRCLIYHAIRSTALILVNKKNLLHCLLWELFIVILTLMLFECRTGTNS